MKLTPYQIVENIKNELRCHESLLFVAFIFFMGFAFSFLASMGMDRSSAAILDNFKPGNIISDAVMANSNSMTKDDIQRFLTEKNPCNNTNYRLYKEQSTLYPKISWHWSGDEKSGHFVCISEETFGEGTEIGVEGGETAAEIIYAAAQENHINPQVLLVLLEKEQGLITDDYPHSRQYRSATGYGCPDTAACDSKYYGFKNQVFRAAELFRYTLDNGSMLYPERQNGVFVAYNPSPSCGGTEVYIENRATASLYRYTPYQPNTSALAAGSGMGDSCSAYGNRNFYLFFTRWFGSTQAAVDGEPFVLPAGKYSLVPQAASSKYLGESSGDAIISDRSITWQFRRESGNTYQIVSGDGKKILAVNTKDEAALTSKVVAAELKDPEKTPAKESSKDAAKNTAKNAAKDTAKDAEKDTTKTPEAEPAVEPVYASGLATCAKLWNLYLRDGDLVIESSCSSGIALSATTETIGLDLFSNQKSHRWSFRTGQTLADGYYTITAKNDDTKAIDISGGKDKNGSNIQIWQTNNQWPQKWYFKYDSKTDSYLITNPRSGRALDLASARTTAGTNIQLWQTTGSCAQRWRAVVDEDGYYTFLSTCAVNRAIDLVDGNTKNCTNVRLWSTNNADAERWKVTPLQLIENGIYTITAKNDPTKAIDISGGKDKNGSNIQIWQVNDEWPQNWEFKYNVIDDYYYITNPRSGRALDLASGRTTPGTNIQLWQSTGSCAQKWRATVDEDGYYTFLSTCAEDRAVDLVDGNTKNCTNVRLWTKNGADAQKWLLQKR